MNFKDLFKKHNVISLLNADKSIMGNTTKKIIINENGDSCFCTNTHIVELGLKCILQWLVDSGFVKSDEDVEKHLPIVTRVCGWHELEHERSSDFDGLQPFLDDCCQLFKEQYNFMTKKGLVFDGNMKVLMNAANKYFGSLDNAIEDGRIERINTIKHKSHVNPFRFFRLIWWLSNSLRTKYDDSISYDTERLMLNYCSIATFGMNLKSFDKKDKSVEKKMINGKRRFLVLKAIQQETPETMREVLKELVKIDLEYLVNALVYEVGESENEDDFNFQSNYQSGNGQAGPSRDTPSPIHPRKNQQNENSQDDKSQSSKKQSKKDEKNDKNSDSNKKSSSSTSSREDEKSSSMDDKNNQTEDGTTCQKSSKENLDGEKNESKSTSNLSKSSPENEESQNESNLSSDNESNDGNDNEESLDNDGNDDCINSQPSQLDSNKGDDSDNSDCVDNQSSKLGSDSDKKVDSDNDFCIFDDLDTDSINNEDLFDQELFDEIVKAGLESMEFIEETFEDEEFNKYYHNNEVFMNQVEDTDVEVDFDTFVDLARNGLAMDYLGDLRYVKRSFPMIDFDIDDVAPFRGVEEGDLLLNQKRGFIDTNELYNLAIPCQTNIFYRELSPSESYAYEVLIDKSASMKNESKWTQAIKSAQCCESLLKNYPLRISTFCEDETHKVCMDLIKDYTDNSELSYSLSYGTHFKPTGCNRDGFAIRVSTSNLMKRMEDNKILIIISDGLPNAHNYSGYAAIQDTALAISQAKQNGVKVLGIAVGSMTERNNTRASYAYMYDNDFLDCSSPQLPMVVSDTLNKIMMYQ